MQSILDQDLYTFTVGQAVLQHFPDAEVEYTFTNRNKNMKFTPGFLKHLQAKIDTLPELRLSSEEQKFMRTQTYLNPQYIEWLSNYRFDPNEVKASLTPDNDLEMSIKGNWGRTIHWEVPLLYEVCDSYYSTIDTNWDDTKQNGRIDYKIDVLESAGATYSDFGTRRRRNYESQARVVSRMKGKPGFRGTSNVLLAMLNDVDPRGTQSHQWIMGISALDGLLHANRFALDRWVDTYQGQLGIALPDTFGTDAFFRDFGGRLARLYDGVRHDSGDPFAFANKMVNHYKSLYIKPSSKLIVFSDGLNVELAKELKIYCDKLGIMCTFGIGTHFTNDFPGSPAMNIVIKLSKVNGIPVVKLSDVFGKAIGDPDAMRIAYYIFSGRPLDGWK